MTVKRMLFWVVNIAVPLLIGLAVYVTMTEDTYVSRSFWRLLGKEAAPVIIPREGSLRFCRDHLCDMCWAYSMVFCVAWIIGDHPTGLAVSAGLSAAFAALMELMQLAAIFPGTFDGLDIILEVLSCLMAGMIIYIKWRKRK